MPEPQAVAAAAVGSDSLEPFAASSESPNGAGPNSVTVVQMDLAPSEDADADPSASPLEALQQKFAAHKVTALERKGS
jgi:hypothetical protein